MNATQTIKRSCRTLASAGLIAALLAACQPAAVRPPVSVAPPAEKLDTTGTTPYQVDSAASTLHVLVYRGGAMARLGHNHVVSSSELSGTVYLHPKVARSVVTLSFPVNTLVVDDPQARSEEGADFDATVPDDARQGTLRNLLRPEVLDGERYPAITLQSVAVSGTRELPSLIMRITIRDVSREVVVLARVQEEGRRLVAEGEFEIQQSDFGITPFSVGLGALVVQDRLKIRFRIVAIA